MGNGVRRATWGWAGVLALALCCVDCGSGGGGTAASTNADLLSLVITGVDLSPAFDMDTMAYDIGPAVLPESVTVTADVADAGASLDVNGMPVTAGVPSQPIPLAMGTTVVSVQVTAADGVTRKTYTVAMDATSAELAGLAASAGALQPGFDATTLTYGVGPALEPVTTTITPTAADPGATVTVNGVPVPSGNESAGVLLPAGLTPVTVEVTARDGVTTSTYSVVFDRSLGGQRAYLKASNTGTGDGFGHSVAISGDTLVVGARDEGSSAIGVNGDETDNGAGTSGAAYVFARSGETWTQQAYLKASNTGAGDNFGWSVAVSGDTLIVGAPYERSAATGVDGDGNDDSAYASGAAYIFVRTGTTWTQQAYLKASNTGSDDHFGSSVSISDDTAIVGAEREASSATGVNGNQSDDSSPSSGAAYVFVRSGTTWTQQAYLKASNTGSGDHFGGGVAISGDTVVVSARHESSDAVGVDGDGNDDSAPASGAAYVFVRSGTTWTQQAYLKASNAGDYDLFGSSVGIHGDSVIVGASLEDSSATGVNGDQSDNSTVDSGAAYLFVRAGTTWTQQAYLKASNGDEDDQFGFGVAIGDHTAAVAAQYEASGATGVDGDEGDDSATRSGAVYLFMQSGGTGDKRAYLKASNTGAYDIFGWSVAISHDTVVVGAWFEDSNATGVNGDGSDDSATGSGAAYVFR